MRLSGLSRPGVIPRAGGRDQPELRRAGEIPANRACRGRRRVAGRAVSGSHPPEDAMTQPSGTRPRTARWAAVTVLLLLGVVGTLIVPVYARTSPKWGPLPYAHPN